MALEAQPKEIRLVAMIRRKALLMVVKSREVV